MERGWSQDSENRLGSAEWVKEWREGMRERDELVSQGPMDSGSGGSAAETSAGTGASGSGKSVFGAFRSSFSVYRANFLLLSPSPLPFSSHRQCTRFFHSKNFRLR